jgi:polyribonucleotide nucleotidyltransferase
LQYALAPEAHASGAFVLSHWRASRERKLEAGKGGGVTLPEIGKIYEGVVKTTTSFGAFVEILPGTEGLCHISELQEGRTENTEEVLKRGDVVAV